MGLVEPRHFTDCQHSERDLENIANKILGLFSFLADSSCAHVCVRACVCVRERERERERQRERERVHCAIQFLHRGPLLVSNSKDCLLAENGSLCIDWHVCQGDPKPFVLISAKGYQFKLLLFKLMFRYRPSRIHTREHTIHRHVHAHTHIMHS